MEIKKNLSSLVTLNLSHKALDSIENINEYKNLVIFN